MMMACTLSLTFQSESISSKQSRSAAHCISQHDEFVRLMITMPDDSCHDLELIPVRKNRRVLSVAHWFVLPSRH